MSNGQNNGLQRKRLRTSHACDPCRLRKIRCNGEQPCATCRKSNESCEYGSEANARGKSDLILESVLRVEQLLQQVVAPPANTSPESASISLIPQAPTHASQYSSSPYTAQENHIRPPSRSWNTDSFENAVLGSMHTSTTESILQWPHFDSFPRLRANTSTNFELERARPSMRIQNRPVHPYVGEQRMRSVLDKFAHGVNFWYPTLADHHLNRMPSLLSGDLSADENVAESCLALLTLALGCANEVIEGLADLAEINEDDKARRAQSKALGDIYFNAALQKMYAAHADISPTAAHCLLLTALYFAFLSRPLQAWEYVRCTATKCLVLLESSSQINNAEDEERTRRIFWSCYMLESDYVAEFSGLPSSGIAAIESNISLPGTAVVYSTHASSDESEQACLYFLACISMRRLLNRVHHLLYANDTGVALTPASFPSVVAELSHQLEEWRTVLPPAFEFSVGFNIAPCKTEAGGFLRQRYLTCRSVIYRPYLMLALSGASQVNLDASLTERRNSFDQDLLTNSKECMDACLLHILNLRGFQQTVLVDRWICSLSMAGAMLVLLAATRLPALYQLISNKLPSAGSHLQHLLTTWQDATGNDASPSSKQALDVICEVHNLVVEREVSHERSNFRTP